jgi:DNA (cytosine-5)-methyltransferase 1
VRPVRLTEFLRDTESQRLLSLKATRGFLSRTERAKLRFVPGFLEAVRRHERAMELAEGGNENGAQAGLFAAA